MKAVIGFVLISASLSIVAVKLAPQFAAGARDAVAVAETEAPSRVRPPGGRKVVVPADPSGHYFTSAVVNGHTIAVVIDTGATAVALTAESARRLGLELDLADYDTPISTANGVVVAASVTLAEIRLGAIAVENVEALVVPGDGLAVNLLGMSFLGRLQKFEVGGGQLLLVE